MPLLLIVLATVAPIFQDIIDIDFLVVAELECAFALFFAECLGFVDLGVFWQFAVCFHWKGKERFKGSGLVLCPAKDVVWNEELRRTATGFVGSVFDDNICFIVLELSQ